MSASRSKRPQSQPASVTANASAAHPHPRHVIDLLGDVGPILELSGVGGAWNGTIRCSAPSS